MAEKAEKKEYRRRGRRAGERTGHASAVALRWRQAERARDAWVGQERAWQQVEAACALFRADGPLPTRAPAEAAVAAALPGERWAPVGAENGAEFPDGVTGQAVFSWGGPSDPFSGHSSPIWPTSSPPAMVARASNTFGSILAPRHRTEASTNTALVTAPWCRLPNWP